MTDTPQVPTKAQTASQAWNRNAFRYLAGLALMVLLIGTVVYRIIEDWSWVDSFYFSSVTLTTVGFGDLSPSTDLSKIFTVFYIFSGISLIGATLNAFLKKSRHEGRQPHLVELTRGSRSGRYPELGDLSDAFPLDERRCKGDLIDIAVAVDALFELLYPFEEDLDHPDGMVIAALLERHAQRRRSRDVLVDHTTGQAYNGRTGRHVLHDYGSGPHASMRSDVDGAEDLPPGSDNNTIAEGWVALLPLEAGSAQRHALVQHHVVADLGGFADHDTHAVIDDESSPDRGTGVDLDAGHGAAQLADESRAEWMTPRPQAVSQTVHRHRMESGIEEQHLGDAAGRRVTVEDRLNVLAEPPPEAKPQSLRSLDTVRSG